MPESKMRSNKTLFKVADFISWKKQGRLILSPDFQRGSVWNAGAKSFLIDTIVRGLPIPIILIRDRRTDPDDFKVVREVVDGQQRLRTVISYVSPENLEDFDPEADEFTIRKAHDKELAGKKFSELDSETKEAILEYEFNVHILPPRTDDREIIQIFRRMNATKHSLQKQELRNAHYFGEFKTSVCKLAAEQLPRWRKWKTFTGDDISKMAEAEFVSECLILILRGEVSGKSSVKIDQFYKRHDEVFNEREEVEKRFRSVADSVDNLTSRKSSPFVLAGKKTCYAFFAYIYHLLYGMDGLFLKDRKGKRISEETKDKIFACNELLYKKKAPADVLEASERHTTTRKQRKRMFDFFLKGK